MRPTEGVLEVVQLLISVQEQLARTGRRFFLTTLTLVLAMTLLLSWLVRRHLWTRLARFIEAVRALGGGELSHRVEPDAAVGKLSGVAEQLNRMADRLESARRGLAQEARGAGLARAPAAQRREARRGRAARGRPGPRDRGASPRDPGRADLLLRTDLDVPDRNRNLSIIIRPIDRIAGIAGIAQDLLK